MHCEQDALSSGHYRAVRSKRIAGREDHQQGTLTLRLLQLKQPCRVLRCALIRRALLGASSTSVVMQRSQELFVVPVVRDDPPLADSEGLASPSLSSSFASSATVSMSHSMRTLRGADDEAAERAILG